MKKEKLVCISFNEQDETPIPIRLKASKAKRIVDSEKKWHYISKGTYKRFMKFYDGSDDKPFKIAGVKVYLPQLKEKIQQYFGITSNDIKFAFRKINIDKLNKSKKSRKLKVLKVKLKPVRPTRKNNAPHSSKSSKYSISCNIYRKNKFNKKEDPIDVIKERLKLPKKK